MFTNFTAFFVILTMVIVFTGVAVMVIGGKLHKKYGNKLMIARISCQAIAIFLLFILSQTHS